MDRSIHYRYGQVHRIGDYSIPQRLLERIRKHLEIQVKKVFQVLWLGDSPPTGKLVWHGEVCFEASSRKKAKKVIEKICRDNKKAEYEVALTIREVYRP
jgi:hypothetical protein